MGKKKEDAKKANRVGRAVTLWLSADTFAALERWRARQTVPPNRTSIVERAIIDFLRGQGETIRDAT